MTRPNPEPIDQWSYYDYKPVMQQRGSTSLLPGWVPPDDRRRLAAYMMLAAYVRNNGRAWLPTTLNEDEVLGRREYGDPAVIVDSVVSSLLGEEQHILVKGAVGQDPAVPGAVAQQELLEAWAKKERLLSKMLENERRAVELGDAVYVLGWDQEKLRPRLRVYDPGFYFPVLDPEDDVEFPSTIHLCWEFEAKDDRGEKKKYLRRITWSLMEVEELVAAQAAGQKIESLPWEEDPSTKRCFMWDGTWLLDDIDHMTGLFDLSVQAGNWTVFGMNLGIDFIPVIHVPNSISEIEHFGTSSLARVLQILDDIVSTDTDLQASSATTGSPPIAVNGQNIPTQDGKIQTYGPGTVLQTGDGSATMIDTANSLNALLEYDKHLLSRLSVNGRIPEALLGRVKPNEVPSGIALALGFTPHANLIKELRLIRRQKYELLLKFVSRMYMQAGLLTEVHEAGVFFGSFLPADRQEASTLVTQLYRDQNPVISLETALEILIQAGIPIEDAAQEIDKIMHGDLEGANRLLDATGDSGLVFQRLGLQASAAGVTGTEDVQDPGTDLPDGA